MIGSTYLFKDPPIVKTTGQIKTTDSSQIVKEKSTELVSKFGLDFELFYNVRNALNFLWPNQILLLNFQEYFLNIAAHIKAILKWCEEKEGSEEDQCPPQAQLRL